MCFSKIRYNGKPTFSASYHEQPKVLYRTNPSIPRPESKYGTRSGVYEQILALKQASLDTKGYFLIYTQKKFFMFNFF